MSKTLGALGAAMTFLSSSKAVSFLENNRQFTKSTDSITL
jgi:hypothetical protein